MRASWWTLGRDPHRDPPVTAPRSSQSTLDRESDNNKIIIDWLTESVKEIQSEIRELVIKETEDKHFASVKDVENVRKELKKIKLNFKVEEEKHFAAIELIEFDLNHSKGEKVN